jgi:AsmA-like C-terminal region
MLPVLEPAKTSARLQDRQGKSGRHFAITAFRLVILLAVLILSAGGWYLAKKGFGRQWRYRIVEELHKRGVEASVRRLTLDPFRGLVAQDVRIFDYKHRETTLALISEISLDINYAALLHRQPFLNALDVRNAELIFPLPRPDGTIEKAQLSNFRGHVYFPPEQIYVSQAEGTFCGVNISATGQLIKRADYQPSPAGSEEEWREGMATLQKIVAELQKFTFPDQPPSLQIKFSGDLAQLENARMEATLRGERSRRGQYEMRDLFVSADWADQKLTVTQCEWKDNAGAFSAGADWSRQTNNANFQVRSSLDLKAFLDAFGFGEFLADAAFQTPPLVDLLGSAHLSGNTRQIKITGRATLGKFSYKNVPFRELSANFAWNRERTLLRDLRLRHQTGELHADLLDAPNDFRLNIDSTINPGALQAFAPPDLNEFLSQWEWPRTATVHLAVRAQDRRPENWRGDGKIALDRSRFRGVWMNSASANMRFGDGAITYDNLRVARDEGVGTGSFTYDFAKHEVRVANIKSSLHPADAIFWIDPKLWKTVVPYKFRQPPTITANGVYQFRGGKNTRLEVNVEAPGGMDYVFLGKTLPFDRVSSRLLFTNDRLQIVDLHGALLSGNVRGNADISLAHNDPHYHASLTVNQIDFPRLTDLYWQYKTAQGQLSGHYDFTGLGDDSRTMRGSGKVEVTNGDVFAIPIFGPLSGIMGSILPGTGYSIARNGSASFTVKDGIIHTDDFDVAGKLFAMLGRGDIHFLDDKLDFDLRINPKGAGALLAPVYKLFEYKGEGSLKKPDWHPKRF